MTKDKKFDYRSFRDTVSIAVEALNEVLDEGLALHPLQEQRDSVHDWRQIGLGIMGLADMLIEMGIRYGSQEAISICDKIGHYMAIEAIYTSSSLARCKNPYPKYNKKIISSLFYNENSDFGTKNMVKEFGLRNSQLLTIAPTGSLSSMLGVSGGIEPIYANFYTRKTESLHGEDKYYKVYTPIVEQYMKEHELKDDSELPDYFVTAQTLNYKERIDMQSVWQKHIDASISSTVNVPNSFTVEQVEDLYMYAWEKGLKGVTIFRDGCKRAGILTTDTSKKSESSNDSIESKSSDNELKRGMIIKADDNCIGKKRTLVTGCGTLHCEAFFDPDTGELLETYLSKGSTGGCQSYMTGLSRMMSLAARGGVDIYSIVDQLKSSTTCPSYAVRRATKKDTSPGSCCPMAVGNALMDMYKEMQQELNEEPGEKAVKPKKISFTKIKKPVETKNIQTTNAALCPICGEPLQASGGCFSCPNDGYSKCD